MLVVALCACKPRVETGSEAKADFVDQRPSNGQSWTEARTVSLNNYARDLLNFSGDEAKKFNELQLQIDESLKTAGVRNPEPLSTYALKLGPYSECFGDARSEYDLWWNSHRDRLVKQVEETAYFIRDFHYKMFGRARGMFTFKEVILCPEAKVGQKMKLEGYKLYIGIPYAWGKYVVIPNKAASGTESLESLWASGAPIGVDKPDRSFIRGIIAQFGSEERARRAVQAAWKLFNPTSTLRISIRQMLHENGGSLGNRLRALRQRLADAGGGAGSEGLALTGDDASLKREIETDFLGEGNPDTALVDRAKIAPDVMTTFKGLAGEKLRAFISNWDCFVTNTEHRADIENDAIGMAQTQMQIETNNVNKDVRAGLVAVVNHHRVGVSVQGSVGPYGKYVGVVTNRETNISTTVRAGLVAVDTSDDISVNLGFSVNTGRAIQTAGFERAVNAAEGGRSLCQ